MHVRRLILLTVALLSACGPAKVSGPAASPTSESVSPSASPAASSASVVGASCQGITSTVIGSTTAAPLFAFLETRRPGVKESEYAGSHDTLALAAPDGYARLRVSFPPRQVPDIGAAGGAVPVLQPEAVIAAGGVYLIDGHGAVCRIDRSGSTRNVTAFPLTSQQRAASFVVSPAGKQLMAAVLTYPTYSAGATSYQPVISGSWKLDIELAQAGGPATIIHHSEWPPYGPPGVNNIVMAGWDGSGPIAIVRSYEGIVSSGVDGLRWPGDLSVHAVRMNLDGTVGQALGPNTAAIDPNGCGLVFLEPRSGGVLCETAGGPGINSQVVVATVGGQVVWETPSGIAATGGFSLSPDGSRVAMDGTVVARDGSSVPLPNNFKTRGWLDSQTIVGLVTGSTPPTIGIIHLNAPNSVENWGFSGQFAGVLGG